MNTSFKKWDKERSKGRSFGKDEMSEVLDYTEIVTKEEGELLRTVVRLMAKDVVKSIDQHPELMSSEHRFVRSTNGEGWQLWFAVAKGFNVITDDGKIFLTSTAESSTDEFQEVEPHIWWTVGNVLLSWLRSARLPLEKTVE